MRVKLLPLVMQACVIAGALGTSDWSYAKAYHWKEEYPDCGGNDQSPINIRDVHYDAHRWDHWNFTGWDLVNGLAFSFGHNVDVTFSTPPNTTLKVSGGNLTDEYCFSALHFHWSDNEAAGSEHRVEGKKFPMEMHMVHYKCKYGSVSDAIASKDKTGLAVLGFFVDETNQSSPLDDPAYVVTHVLDIMKKAGSHGFYRYHGSLTTPPCTQDVVWTVFKNPLLLPKKDIHLAHKILEKITHVSSNDRPVQAGHGRQVEDAA